jgi:hypothetical protein
VIKLCNVLQPITHAVTRVYDEADQGADLQPALEASLFRTLMMNVSIRSEQPHDAADVRGTNEEAFGTASVHIALISERNISRAAAIHS